MPKDWDIIVVAFATGFLGHYEYLAVNYDVGVIKWDFDYEPMYMST